MKDKFQLKLIILLVIIFILMFLMLYLGNTIYDIQTIFKTLILNQDTNASFTLKILRLPRMLVALMCGICFGVSGSVFQTVFRNPLANPDVLGISAASSIAAIVVTTILNISELYIIIFSILSGILTVCLIIFLTKNRLNATNRIIMIGIAFQALLTAVVSYLTLSADQQDLPQITRWLSGSLNSAQISDSYILFAIIIVVLPIIFVLARSLVVIELGDETAQGLGVDVRKTRLTLLICSVILVSSATAITGPIAFVSFLAGPISRHLVRDTQKSIVLSAFVGIIIVMGADLIGQFVFAFRIPVGLITGLFGAPYLIYIIISKSREGAM